MQQKLIVLLILCWAFPL